MKLSIGGQEIDLDNDQIKAALEKGEDLTVAGELVVRTAQEVETRERNLSETSKQAGFEIGRKEVLKGLGIEGEGLHKSDDTAINSIKSWAEGQVKTALTDANIEPNKKLEEYQKDITTLKGTVKSLTTEKEDLLNEFKTYKNTNLINSTLGNHIPENTVIPKDDVLTILKGKIRTDIDENGNVFALGKDGQPLKDNTTLEPLPINKVVESFFNDNPQYLPKTQGGAGGGDSSQDSAQGSMESFIEEMEGQGIKPNSEKFNAEMMSRINAGTLKA